MERLSGLDASFLYLETSAQLLHVCGVIVLDPETIPGAATTSTSSRTSSSAGSPTSRCSTASSSRCRSGSTTRCGSIDDDFDIDRHVHRMAVPSPGGDRELADLCGHLAGIPLDRSRPLWEFFVIEGLESGKVAVFTKMHHSHRRRGLRRERDLLPVQPRAGRAADRDAHRRTSASRVRRRDTELLARGVVTSLAKPVADGQDGGADRRRPDQAPSVAPAAGLRWPRRSRRRGPPSTARSPVTARSPLEDMSLEKIKEIKNVRRRSDRQRRGDHVVRGSAAPLPARSAASSPRPRCSPPCRSRCARSRRRPAAATRSPRSSPAWAPTWQDPLERLKEVSTANTQRQGPPQDDPGRHPAGLGRVRRAADLRPRGADGLLAAGWPTPAR